jgi:hypothetical protein
MSSLNNGRHIVCAAGIVLIRNLANERAKRFCNRKCLHTGVRPVWTLPFFPRTVRQTGPIGMLISTSLTSPKISSLALVSRHCRASDHPTPPRRAPFLTLRAVTIPPPRRDASPAAPCPVPRKQTVLDNWGRAAAGPHRRA